MSHISSSARTASCSNLDFYFSPAEDAELHVSSSSSVKTQDPSCHQPPRLNNHLSLPWYLRATGNVFGSPCTESRRLSPRWILRGKGRAGAGAEQGIEVPEQMWLETPCLLSMQLSDMAKRPVYLKLENCQATGSFKDRGLGNCIKKAYLAGQRRVVAVSAGNAGLAAAHAATRLGMPVTVCVPAATSEVVLERLRREGAEVKPHGANLQEAAVLGTSIAKAQNAFLAHPFDHPDIWEGHASMVEELKKQLPSQPAVIAAAVGGGGLIMGVLLGIEKCGWKQNGGTAAVGLETTATASFHESYKAKKVVGFSGATNSIAKSIAVYRPTVALEKYFNDPTVFSEVVTDAQAAQAVVRFADDHRFLVEPAAGAALAFVYSSIINRMDKEGKIPGNPDAPVVIIVCGGNAVTLDLINEWREHFLKKG